MLVQPERITKRFMVPRSNHLNKSSLVQRKLHLHHTSLRRPSYDLIYLLYWTRNLSIEPPDNGLEQGALPRTVGCGMRLVLVGTRDKEQLTRSKRECYVGEREESVSFEMVEFHAPPCR